MIKYARLPEDILGMKNALIEYEGKQPGVTSETKRKRFFTRPDITGPLSRLNSFSRLKKKGIRCEICK